ncbi:hypothetical protein CHS0354_005748 [Potamilus streckersoni]|uniref:Uncharacterized protein n=1 Tax=Potamilus streckersoni TaxID=2493646 RepID=A0AAE0VJM9_9BIVA|nr:hypothetical protein CHS0354_005748 [Potamilus streckersoni]
MPSKILLTGLSCRLYKWRVLSKMLKSEEQLLIVSMKTRTCIDVKPSDLILLDEYRQVQLRPYKISCKSYHVESPKYGGGVLHQSPTYIDDCNRDVAGETDDAQITDFKIARKPSVTYGVHPVNYGKSRELNYTDSFIRTLEVMVMTHSYSYSLMNEVCSNKRVSDVTRVCGYSSTPQKKKT